MATQWRLDRLMSTNLSKWFSLELALICHDNPLQLLDLLLPVDRPQAHSLLPGDVVLHQVALLVILAGNGALGALKWDKN